MNDWWKPEAGDPFWMLEAEDGEWLKNEHSMLGTRDASEAIRFPTEVAANNHPARMKPGYKWWSANATEHKWIDPPMTTIEQGDELARAVLREALSAILVLVGDLRALTTAEDRKPYTGMQMGVEAGKRIDEYLRSQHNGATQVNEPSIAVQFAVAYVDGYVEDEPAEFQRNWKRVKDAALSTSSASGGMAG